MRADYQQGKLYLFYDNQPEREKLFDFLALLVNKKHPAEVGLLELTEDPSRWGVYFRALIDNDLQYMTNIQDVMKVLKEKSSETQSR